MATAKPVELPSDAKTFLKAIQPPSDAREEKFSYNLHRYLLRKAKHSGQRFPPPIYQEKDGTLHIAYRKMEDDDWWLTGCRLVSALCYGARAQTYANGRINQKSAKDITQEFWTAYFAKGKCAINPKHTMYPECWIVSNHSRRCRWCGYKERKVVTFKQVRVVTWKHDHA